jgi:hypothetical protein
MYEPEMKEAQVDRYFTRIDARRTGLTATAVLALAAPASALGSSGAAGGGLSWRDAAAGLAILAAVLLLVVWGDVVVGAAIAVVTGLIEAGARLATGEPRRERGWSEWSRPAARPVERQQSRQRPLSRKPVRN